MMGNANISGGNGIGIESKQNNTGPIINMNDGSNLTLGLYD